MARERSRPSQAVAVPAAPPKIYPCGFIGCIEPAMCSTWVPGSKTRKMNMCRSHYLKIDHNAPEREPGSDD